MPTSPECQAQMGPTWTQTEDHVQMWCIPYISLCFVHIILCCVSQSADVGVSFSGLPAWTPPGATFNFNTSNSVIELLIPQALHHLVQLTKFTDASILLHLAAVRVV